MEALSISAHWSEKMCFGHNMREEKYLNQKNIDKELTKNNIILANEKPEDFYNRVFEGEYQDWRNSIKKKNARPKGATYWDHIKNGKMNQKPCKEIIVALGNRKTVGTSGPLAEACKKVLQEYYEHWKKDNAPYYQVANAAIHCDEPGGTIHLHMQVIPCGVREDKKSKIKKMIHQASQTLALENLGYESKFIDGKNPLTRFQEREREIIQKIAKKHGLETCLNTETHRLKHLNDEEFIAINEEKEKNAEEKAALEESKSKLRDNVQNFNTKLKTWYPKAKEKAISEAKAKIREATKKAIIEAERSAQKEISDKKAELRKKHDVELAAIKKKYKEEIEAEWSKKEEFLRKQQEQIRQNEEKLKKQEARSSTLKKLISGQISQIPPESVWNVKGKRLLWRDIMAKVESKIQLFAEAMGIRPHEAAEEILNKIQDQIVEKIKEEENQEAEAEAEWELDR